MSGLVKILFVLFLFSVPLCATALAQNNNDPEFPFPSRDRRRDEDSKLVKDMLAKQQSEHEKKEHEELLSRAETLLILTKDLEESLEKNAKITPEGEKKLLELEKAVKKIRGGLGGDDDDTLEDTEEESKPSDLSSAFQALKTKTAKLVDEIKKTSRFSISAVAIQSSNAVIRMIKFLRLKK